MNRDAYCLDTSVLVKVLVPEDGSDEANALLKRAISAGGRLVAPAFAWAEVGTVLRKKLRANLISEAEASTAWARFVSLSIEYLQDPKIPQFAWEISSKFQLPTMYDAAFLAVSQRAAEESGGTVEFWTADQELVGVLGYSAPQYVRLLSPQR